jgi:adenine/guanine phosphoribosyltransferase-like PRPP-binding protein
MAMLICRRQAILPAHYTPSSAPFQYGFPAILPNGTFLELPIRPLNGRPDHAVASLLMNHASFEVSEALERELADLLRPLKPDIIIGLPTLGLGPAASVAKKLGHCMPYVLIPLTVSDFKVARYVPLGYSRKFWYDNNLSTLLSSITSPLGEKRVFLDPNLLPLIKGKKAAIIDDAVSSGTFNPSEFSPTK